MVSLITEGSSTDKKGRPYRRRRMLPMLVLLVVLALVGALVWFRVFTATDALPTTVNCNAPAPASDPSAPAPAPLGTEVDSAALADTAPAALSATRVRVFNANGARGQAAQVASQLSDLGFASAPDVQVGNDPVYVDQNMQCQSQIRFGSTGLAAASAVWLVEPCAELIQDARTDDTVDLALGTYFSEIQPNSDAEEVLRSLKDAAPGATPSALDPALVKAARQVKC